MSSLFDQIVEIASQTGDIKDRAFRKRLRGLKLYPDRDREETILRRLTRKLGDGIFDRPAFTVPKPEDLKIPNDGLSYISIGSIVKAVADGYEQVGEATLPLVSGHTAILGGTRMGKTMAAVQNLASLPDHVRRVLADPENDPALANFALQLPPERFRIVGWQDLRVNIFEPPANTSYEVWLGQTIRNLRESRYLGDGSVSLLNSVLASCLKDRPDQPVHVRQVYEKLLDLRYKFSKGGREASWWETLRNRMEGLLTSPVFNCVTGFGDQLIATDLLLQLRGMPADDFVLWLNDFLLRLSCLFQPDLNPEPSHVVMIDELHRVTNAKRLKRADVSEPIVLDAVRALAKCRINFWLLDQNPAELPPEILNNCGVKMVFNLGDARELDAVQRSFGLDWEQRKAISRLPRRTCVVLANNPNFPEPFLVRIRDRNVELPPPETVTQRIKESLAGLSYLPGERGIEIASTRAAAGTSSVSVSPPLISQAAVNYLVLISKDQLIAITVRDTREGFGLSEGSNLRKELAAAGLVRIEKIPTFGPSRTIGITWITEKGYELLTSMGVSFERPKGKGGPFHVYHQHAIARWGRQHGYEARIEFFAGKNVDVALQKDGIRIGVEILAEGVSKEFWNLRDLESVEELWFALKSLQDEVKLRELIVKKLGTESQGVLARVRFRLLAGFQAAEQRVVGVDEG